MAFKKKGKFDIYEAVTEKIIARLEQGEIPWQKPWNAKVGMPRNLISNKEYQGMNLVMLGSQNYDNPYWLSFKQCQEKGGTVKKGEKGSMIVFWSYLDKATGKPANTESDSPVKTNSKDIVPILRYYTVFNANQCENLITPSIPEPESIHAPIEAAAKIIDSMQNRPEIEHGFTKACFIPSQDKIKMPDQSKFTSPEHYYGTLFHELTHSTGHESRLNRTFGKQFGDEQYSKEELIAEMGAAFLCAKSSIENPAVNDNTAAYIQSWLKALKEDKKMIITAAGHAQKAVNHIIGPLEKNINLGSTESISEAEFTKEQRKAKELGYEIQPGTDPKNQLTENQQSAIQRLQASPHPQEQLVDILTKKWSKGTHVPESDYLYRSIGNFTVEAIQKGNNDVRLKKQGMSM